MNLLTQIKHKTQKGEEVIMDIGAKASNVLPENFVEQKERSNLTAKDKLPVIFGKLSKWYTDLKAVAWSGSYSDLTNKPTIPEGSAANYQVANNDTTEAEGFVADARIVRMHGLEIDGLSRDLGQGRIAFKWEEYSPGQAGIRFYVDDDNLVATLPQWTIGSTCQITYENGDFYGNYNGVKKKLGNVPEYHVVSTGRSLAVSTYAENSEKITIPDKEGKTAVGGYIENVRAYNSNGRLNEASISAIYSNGVLTVSCPAGKFSEGWSAYYFDVVGIYI